MSHIQLPLAHPLHPEDLKAPLHLHDLLETIRHHIVGVATGITRDETIATQLIYLFFCKIYDEKNTKEKELLSFQIYPAKNIDDVSQRVYDLFSKVKEKYGDIFNSNEDIIVDKESLVKIVSLLESYSFINSKIDVIGDAFEGIISPSFRGGEGQFFTPQNVADLMIEILKPMTYEKIIDPACGSGGFLRAILNYFNIINCDESNKEEFFSEIASSSIFGIDKDAFLVKIAKAHMTLIGDGRSNIFCENSLDFHKNWSSECKQRVELNKFDVVITNPPFGVNIELKGEARLSQYALGKVWKRKKSKENWELQNNVRKSQDVTILFIERCIQFLKEGGRMGIVLPEGYFASASHFYIWEYLLNKYKITHIVDLPRLTFLPYTDTKTMLLFLEKSRPSEKDEIKMLTIENIGHDKNGKPIYEMDERTKGPLRKTIAHRSIIRDDIPKVILKMRQGSQKDVFKVVLKKDIKNGVLIPRYYNNEVLQDFYNSPTNKNFKLVSMKQLVDEGIIKVLKGKSIDRSDLQGGGDIPYVRTSDIIDWDIFFNPQTMVPSWVFENISDRYKVKEDDILMVRRGRYRIGNCAIVTNSSKKILVVPEISIFRIIKPVNKYHISAEYLLYALSQDFVKAQMRNKIFVETTLMNLAERWAELLIPIPTEKEFIDKIGKDVREIINYRKRALDKIRELMNSNNLKIEVNQPTTWFGDYK